MSKNKEATKKSPRSERKAKRELQKHAPPQLSDATAAPPAEVVEEPKKDKKKKRKLEDAADGEEAPSKKSKKAKSKAAAEDAKDEVMEDAAAAEPVQAPATGATKNEKKAEKRAERKAEKKAAKAAKKAASVEGAAHHEPEAAEDAAVGADLSPLGDQEVDAGEEASANKREKFICFIGNLPFSATKADVEKHFEKIKPKLVRLMTDKKTGKSRGFAFVEFDNYDKMKTCLAKYQHSLFQERKINVELTAGGGGNTSHRKEKIQAKNDKLQEERQRQHERKDEIEAKQKERKEKKEQKANRDNKKKGEKKGSALKELENSATKPAEPESGASAESTDNSGMHPARLAMLNQPPRSNWQPRKRF